MIVAWVSANGPKICWYQGLGLGVSELASGASTHSYHDNKYQIVDKLHILFNQASSIKD